MTDQRILITIDADAASDSWGFVGRVMIADHECYRTLQAFPSPSEALNAAQQVVGNALGALLAGEEWRQLGGELGHVPRRTELNFGLRAGVRPVSSAHEERSSEDESSAG